MIACLRLLAYFVISLLKSRRRLEAEIVSLGHQLNVLRRAAPSTLRLTFTDRLILVWLYRLFPSLIEAVASLNPRRCCGGTVGASGFTGVGNLAQRVAGPSEVDPEFGTG